ncbi:hypothetical protein GCM10012319_72200 [Comamonas sp. KCTC 72670]|nr:hypothetical protein GCM10012319_72200 [Comamonas sp. KCTC 72670]
MEASPASRFPRGPSGFSFWRGAARAADITRSWVPLGARGMPGFVGVRGWEPDGDAALGGCVPGGEDLRPSLIGPRV